MNILPDDVINLFMMKLDLTSFICFLLTCKRFVRIGNSLKHKMNVRHTLEVPVPVYERIVIWLSSKDTLVRRFTKCSLCSTQSIGYKKDLDCFRTCNNCSKKFCNSAQASRFVDHQQLCERCVEICSWCISPKRKGSCISRCTKHKICKECNRLDGCRVCILESKKDSILTKVLDASPIILSKIYDIINQKMISS